MGERFGVFEKLKEAIQRLFTSPEEKSLSCEARAFTVEVECDRCGEIIPVRIDRDHEVQPQYSLEAEEGDHPDEWLLRKEVVGSNCQNLVRFALTFGSDQCLKSSAIEGGKFVAEDLEEAREDSGEES